MLSTTILICREFDDFKIGTGQATHANLQEAREKEFAGWLRKKVLLDREGEMDSSIRNLGLQPNKTAVCYGGYEVNGFKFHSETYGQNKSTVNSGVCIRGQSGEDEDQLDYYGVLQEVVGLSYEGGNTVILFRCDWFDIPSGVKEDKERGIVEIKHASRLRYYDPFVLAVQALQVYYLPYASTSADIKNWWVAIKTQKKGKLGVQESGGAFQEEHTVDPNNQSVNPMDLLPSMSTEQEEMASDDDTVGLIINIEQVDEEEDTDPYDMM
jgi:hypothetical protein